MFYPKKIRQMRNQIFGRGVTKRRNQPVTKFRKVRNYFSEVMGGGGGGGGGAHSTEVRNKDFFKPNLKRFLRDF
ncbi:hypothetical protein A4S02_07120 [Acetobacter ascendens]|uniref:Uncharacterized protein n=1 Tax=Acetobacter ascendens TaxID=481146 RepID=A0A1D8QW61_9PROT|nr:hypothetical protein A4S02_07120 [Acetobacter ascendens]